MALRESEDRYKVLYENNPTVMVLFDPGTLKIVDANPTACLYYGYSRSKITSKLVTQISQRDPEDFGHLFGDIFEKRQIRYTAKHRLASGAIRDVEVFSGPIRMGGNQYIISTINDITERVAADESLRKRIEELAVLHSIALAGAEAVDEDALIERATQVISRTLYSDVTGILLLDSTRQYLVPHQSYWGINQAVRNKKISIDRCTSGQTIITGQPVRCGDVSVLPVYFQVDPSTHSELCVPIKSGDRSIGVINIESTRYNAYSEVDEELMLTVAGQLATAIERLRTEKAEREQAQQLSTIYEIGQEILTAKMDSEQVYRSIHRAVGHMMPCEAFVIVRVDQEQKDLVTVYAMDQGGRAPVMRLPINSGVSGTVIRTGQSYLYDDFRNVSSFQNVVYFGDPEHTRSGCAVPMRINGQIIGCLSTQSYSPQAFSPSHLHLLELLAAYAAIALENFQLLHETQRQTLTLENMFDAVIQANKDGLISDWNISAEQLFGYPKDEAIGMSPAGLFALNPNDYQAFLAEVYATSSKENRWTGEVDFNHKNGFRGTAEIVILVSYDSNKAINGTTFVFRDITQRKIAEQVLRDSEEQFRFTFEQAAVGIAHTTLKGQFIKINQRFCELLGYTQDEMLGKFIRDITHPEDIGDNLFSMQQLINGQLQTYVTEKRYLQKNGVPIWVHLTVNIARDTQGEPIYFIPVVEDISQRKKTELDILKLVSAVEQSTESIVITDLAGNITYANPALESISGYRANEVLGKKSSLFKSGSHDNAFYDQLWSTIKNGDTWKGTIINRKKNGTLYYEDAAIFPVKDQSGHIINFAAVKRDISNQVLREHCLRLIVDYSTALRKTVNVDHILSVTFAHLGALFQIDCAFILILDLQSNNKLINRGFGAWQTPPPELLEFLNRFYDLLVKYASMDGTAGECNAVRFINQSIPGNEAVLTTIPLMTQDKCRGVLCLARESALDEIEINFLDNFAEITGNAIHRLEMVEIAQRHASQLDSVSAMGRALSEILNLPEIYQVVAKAVKELFSQSSSLLITQYQPNKELITAVYKLVYGFSPQEGSSAWIMLDSTGMDLQSKTILTQLPVIYNAIGTEANQSIHLGPIQEDTQSILLVPMLAKGQVTGVIQVQSPVAEYFDQPKAELLALIGNTAAIAVENARLFAETQTQIRRQAAIHNIDSAIISSLDRKVTLTVLVEQITRQLGIHAAGILLLDPYTNYLVFEVGYGFRTPAISNTRLKLGEGISGKIAIERKPAFIPNLAQSSAAFMRSNLLTNENFVTYIGLPLVARGQVKGVLELFHRGAYTFDPDSSAFIDTLANQAAIAIDNADLFNHLQSSNIELILANDDTIMGWSKAMGWRDNETEEHNQRVADMAVELARLMGIDAEQLVQVRRGALLHDIGKIGIPDSILLKEGPLTGEEWLKIHEHPKIAYEILSPITFLHGALDIPYNHHEKWDGSGYPRGLSGEAIPMTARIFSVIDVWDALLNDRHYRKAWPLSQVIAYLEENSGIYFDPQVVMAFLTLINP